MSESDAPARLNIFQKILRWIRVRVIRAYLQVKWWFKILRWKWNVKRGKIVPHFKGFRKEPDKPDMPRTYPCHKCGARSPRFQREKIGAMYRCRTHGAFLVLHPEAVRRGFRYKTPAELKDMKDKQRRERWMAKQLALQRLASTDGK